MRDLRLPVISNVRAIQQRLNRPAELALDGLRKTRAGIAALDEYRALLGVLLADRSWLRQITRATASPGRGARCGRPDVAPDCMSSAPV